MPATNPLTNVLPPKTRRYFYAGLFVSGLGFAAWQAAHGDWTLFVGGVITSLGGGVAASNTNVDHP